MNDLRSLEGVGHLLSQKMAENNRKTQFKKRGHKRSTSAPKLKSISTPTPSTYSIAIQAYFPAPLAAALQNNIQVGFAQNMPPNRPNLLKSHSGFVSKDIPLQQSQDDTATRGRSVAFHEFQNVISPQQSISPPLSPAAIKQLNSSNHGHEFAFNGRDSNHSIHHHESFSKMPSSPSSRLASFVGGGGSIKLDLDLSLLEADSLRGSIASFGGDSQSNLFLMNDNSSNTNNITNTVNNGHNIALDPISSPDAMEFKAQSFMSLNGSNGTNGSNAANATSPISNDPPPPFPTKRTYSNSSFITLFSADDMSSTDDLLANNTFINSQVPNTPNTKCLMDKIDKGGANGKECGIDIDIMNLQEDFMEYQNEQRDAFNTIGNGASGIVRKAFHFRSCKMVAIKQCRSKQKHEIAAFIKEAKLYQTFEDNKNIVNILGFGKTKENGNLAMAMEYMDLGSIDSLKIAENQYMNMEDKELIVGHIILNTLYALSAIHEKLYVHNDIKPANILSNKYGEIKLSDFGTILQLKNNKAKLTKNCGTQSYQSPEKMIKQPIAYNAKSDIWSLGVTCYELLLGDGYNAQDELAYITNTPQLNTKQHKLSSECCDFINQCLISDDTQRPSADELIEHQWFTKHIIMKDLNEKWPWLIEIEEEKQADIYSAIEALSPKGDSKSKNGKKKRKKVRFNSNSDANGNSLKKSQEVFNEDLLFMISALIIYYATQQVDLDNGDGAGLLYRRVSHVGPDKAAGKTYTDDERISNMAKYALCSKQTVIDRIKATVAHIKSQINKIEKL